MTDLRTALTQALADAMAADLTVVVIGEDASNGGGMGVLAGLSDQFGPRRVIDTPISESAFTGMAVGAALSGLKPVVEVMFADFLAVCMDPLINQAAKIPFLTAGDPLPLVVRCAFGAGDSSGVHHSQALHGLLSGVPGLTVVIPTTPADARAALTGALAAATPTVIMEHKLLYGIEGTLGDSQPTPWPLMPVIRRAGEEVTVVASGLMLQRAVAAAEALARDGGASPTVIDLRTISPMPLDPLIQMIAGCDRLLIVDEAPGPGGYGAALAGEMAARRPGLQLDLLCAGSSPVPYGPSLEEAWLPSVDRIAERITALARR